MDLRATMAVYGLIVVRAPVSHAPSVRRQREHDDVDGRACGQQAAEALTLPLLRAGREAESSSAEDDATYVLIDAHLPRAHASLSSSSRKRQQRILMLD